MGPDGSRCLPAGLTVEDLQCPICMATLRDPFVTPCGHTFCFSCISQHLENRSICPSCAQYTTKDKTFPNFLLSKVVSRVTAAEGSARKPAAEQVAALVADEGAGLGLHDINVLLAALWRRKQFLEQREAECSLELLSHFLQHSREEKLRKVQELQRELAVLDADISHVERHSGRDLVAAAARLCAAPPACGSGGGASVPCKRLKAEAATPPPAQPDALRHRLGRITDVPSVESDSPNSELVLHAGHASLPSTQTAEPAAAAHVGLEERPSGGRAACTAPDGLGEVLGPAMRRPREPAAGPATPHPQDAHATGPVAPRRANGVPDWGNGGPEGAPSVASGAGNPREQALAAQGPQCGRLERHGGGGRDMLATWPVTDAGPVALPSAHSSGLALTPTSSGHMSGGFANGSVSGTEEPCRSRKRRVVSQFEDLQQCYMSMRSMRSGELDDALQEHPAENSAANGVVTTGEASPPAAGATGMGMGKGLAAFSRMLSVFTRCSRLTVIAALPRASLRQSAAILSSIEFDRDSAVFATAGVSKRISIYEYANVLAHPAAERHCPAAELVTRSKLSCLSWNSYIQAHLISSDYEGVVTLWDAGAGAAVSEYEAHEKRIWSVDFCAADPQLFVSGSDDGWVKVWSSTQQAAVAAIDLRANVCCVEYSPACRHQIVVGCADHNVHLYDLRNTATPVYVFTGHRKAVSYVRFLGDGEVVSASTDSTLRLWDVRGFRPARTYKGHLNEKNFVGLSVDSEFIACGSETNEVFVYYRAMSKPIARRVFASPPSGSGSAEEGQFISAVCWKPLSHTLLAANSQGTIKVMQLTS